MRLVVIGAGPGGYTAALAAAQKGIDVVLVEKREIGGTCLNRGCIPTKAFLASAHTLEKIKRCASYGISAENVRADMPLIIKRKNEVVQTLRKSVESLILKRKVTLVKGEGGIVSRGVVSVGDERIECDAIIVATGSEPLSFWDDPSVVDSTGALELSEIPESMLVAGGGAVGVEFACFFAAMGSKVTLVEMADRILPSMDRDVTDTLTRELKKRGIAIRTKTKIESVNNGEVVFSGGKTGRFDKILSAVGRRFNNSSIGLENVAVEMDRGRIRTDLRMETGEKGVYAIGDIAAGFPLLAHVASSQAIVAVRNIAGEEAFFDGSAIPGCIYSSPEAASVGIREDQAENPEVAKIPFRALGRAHAEGEIAGLIKIVAVDGIVKGVHIIGERASDLIHEGVEAVAERMPLNRLAEIIHAHPTFAEIYSEAYHMMEGIPIHA